MDIKDRADAGKRLLDALPPLDPERTVVVALPRGGVPVAEVIADALNVPLDIALVRKVGMPGQKELALAAVTDRDTPKLSVNTALARAVDLSEPEIWELARDQLAEIARRREAWLGGRAQVPIRGKSVVVVDDGIATGATMRAALELLRKDAPAEIILAVPVAPADTLATLTGLVDKVVCLATPDPFIAVGAHYRHFDQVPGRVVAETLARADARSNADQSGRRS